MVAKSVAADVISSGAAITYDKSAPPTSSHLGTTQPLAGEQYTQIVMQAHAEHLSDALLHYSTFVGIPTGV